MDPADFRKLLLILVACIYAAALGAVIFSLFDLQRSHYGSLVVSQASVERDQGSYGRLLRLAGAGFDQRLRAIVIPEPDKNEQNVLLGGEGMRGLWCDGQTLLTSHQGNHLLYLRLDAGGDFRVTGSLRLPGRIGQIVKVGSRALVSVKEQGFYLVDLADPEQLIVVGHLSGGDRLVSEMIAAAGTVYIPDRDGKLHVVEMHGPAPKIRSLDAPGSPWRIALHEQRLVSANLEGGLQLFDLDGRGMPHPVGELQLKAGVRGVSLSAAGLFVALGNGEVQTFSVRNWPQLEKRGSLQVHGQILRMRAVPGEPLLLLSRSLLGFLAVNVAKLEQPVVAAEFQSPDTPRDFCLAGQRVFSISSRGLSVFEQEDLLAGSLHDIRVMADQGYDLYSWEGEIYLSSELTRQQGGQSAGPPSLQVLPPQETCRDRRSDRGARCLAVPAIETGETVYLFCQEPGRDPLRLETSIALPDKQVQAIWRDGAIFTVSRRGPLRIFDATDPQRPVLAGQLDLPGTLFASDWLAPHFLLIAAGANGLYVVNVEDRSRPKFVARLALPEHLRQLSLVLDVLVAAGQRAYLTHGRNGVSLVDLSDPLLPRTLRGVDTAGFASHLAADNELLFVSTNQAGVFLIDIGGEEGWLPVGAMETPVRSSELAACRGRLAVSGGSAGIVQLAMPRKLSVRVAGDHTARIVLPRDLSPGNYRLYLYNDSESLSTPVVFHLPPPVEGQVAQNE